MADYQYRNSGDKLWCFCSLKEYAEALLSPNMEGRVYDEPKRLSDQVAILEIRLGDAQRMADLIRLQRAHGGGLPTQDVDEFLAAFPPREED